MLKGKRPHTKTGVILNGNRERRKKWERLPGKKQEFITGIYYEYERLMFATARRYIDDRTEQEDVVQESLKKLIEKQERLAGLAQAAQAGYVATTVRNTAISILREKTRER